MPQTLHQLRFQLSRVTRICSLLLATAVFFLAACGASRATASKADPKADAYAKFYVDFVHTDKLGEALDQAEAQGKLVFIDFYTSWCLPCKLMDEDVFTDPAFGAFMNERFVSIKIDAEAGNGPNLAALYGVQAYPTLLFVDADGRVKARKEGAAYQTELRQLAREAEGR